MKRVLFCLLIPFLFQSPAQAQNQPLPDGHSSPELTMNPPYLGIDMFDEWVNAEREVLANLSPPGNNNPCSWTLSSAVAQFKTDPGSGNTATIIDTRSPSTAFENETVDVSVMPGSYTDQLSFTVVQVDVAINQVPEDDEETKGAFVAFNDNDDNENEVADHAESPVPGEKDLVPVTITIIPDDLPTDQLVTITGFEHLYADDEKQNQASNQYEVGVLPLTLYLEGDAVSDAPRDKTIQVEHSMSGAKDQALYTVVKVDLDIDSDNNNGFGMPDRSEAEDLIEDVAGDPAKPGKLICVNNGDADADGVPNFADGFDKWNNSGPNAGGTFTPMVLELAEPIDLALAKIKFTYSASDPDGVTRTGTGAPGDPYIYTPAAGHLRIWKVDGLTDRLKADASSGGHFVKSTDSEYLLSDLGSGRTITLYVEGIQNSATVADQQIKVEVDPDGDGPAGYMVSDAVRCTVLKADLDIDSDNNNGFGMPDRSETEDQIEDVSGDPAKPGKLICVNNGDADADGVPNFADGFDKWNNSGPNAGGTFTPMVLELAEPIVLALAKIKFTYSASDPDGVTRTGTGAPGDPYVFTPPAGHLRIWKVDGLTDRLKADASSGGHFVKSTDSEYLLSDLGSGRTITLYVEGIQNSATVADQQIKVEVDPDGDGPAGYMVSDAVRCTIIKVELTNIKFNHDTGSSASDAINIRQDYTTPIDISNGEWVKGGANHPAAYTADNSVTIKARFTVQPDSITSADIWAVSTDSDGSLGDIVKTTVAFSGGISVGDADGYVAFSISGNTPNVVKKTTTDTWQWKAENINGASVVCDFDVSGPHTVYTILNQPVTPWINTANSQLNAWTVVLDYACAWAATVNDESSTVAKITSGAYSGFGKTYDGARTHTATTHCLLSQMLSDDWVDCRDMSAVVQLFSKILGVSGVQVREVDGPFWYKPILPIGSSTWVSGRWNFHQFGWHASAVYDACVKLKESAPYIPIHDDLNGSYKTNLFESDDWTPESPFSITSFD